MTTTLTWTMAGAAAIALTATVGACSSDEATSAAIQSSASGTSTGTSAGGEGGDPGSGAGPGSGGNGGGGIPQECIDMTAAAQAFLDSLEADELMTATGDFGSPEHQHFEFLPPLNAPREGLTMKDMDMEEQDNLHAFLQAALSASGYMKAEAIRALESVLAMQESGMPVTPERDPENYFIQFFGTPSIDSEQPWGFRFTGHHLSIHGGVIACAVFSATPAFWGVSPETTPMQAEVDSAEDLWASLDSNQQAMAQATVGTEAQASKTGKLDPLQADGLRGGDMTADQLALLQQLIGIYLGNMAAPIAADRLAAIEAVGYDDVSFAYDSGDWRILGPTFLIEFVYAGADHIHSVWRDYAGDYGDDLIAQHMAAFRH